MAERPEFSNPFTNGRIIGHDINPMDYHKRDESIKRGDPAFIMSRSELMKFNTNPWKWVMGTEEDSTKSTEWGDLMDCVILQPDRFDDRFEVSPATFPATKSMTVVREGECAVGDQVPWDPVAGFCKKWKKEVERTGKTPIKTSLMDDADAAQEVLFNDPQIVKVLQASKKQVMVTAEYRDKATGMVVQFKILIDLLPDRTDDEWLSRSVLDLKTAQSAAPRLWAKQVMDYDYYVQGTCYLDVYASAVPNERDLFKHIVQENTRPFYPMLHELSDTHFRLGREKYVPALRKYCQCVKNNQWPGYEALPGQLVRNGWHTANPPDWALK